MRLFVLVYLLVDFPSHTVGFDLSLRRRRWWQLQRCPQQSKSCNAGIVPRVLFSCEKLACLLACLHPVAHILLNSLSLSSSLIFLHPATARVAVPTICPSTRSRYPCTISFPVLSPIPSRTPSTPCSADRIQARRARATLTPDIIPRDSLCATRLPPFPLFSPLDCVLWRGDSREILGFWETGFLGSLKSV